MRILDRYIGLHVLGGYLLVMLVLITLFAFIDFVDQLDNLGKGDYGLVDAIEFVLLMAPRRMMDLAPATALLGGSLALGTLASSNQLVVMRAAGVSVGRIGWAVMKAALLLVLGVVILTQFIAPPLQQRAYERQLLQIGKIRDLRTNNGFWSRDSVSFINIGRIQHGRIPSQINIYEFDPQGRLLSFIHADSADITQHERWLLRDVWQKTQGEEGLITARLPERMWDSFLTEDQIQVLEYPADSLAPVDLYEYIQYLRDSGQETAAYDLQLWQKLVLPLTTAAMALLAIPFVFGLPRLAGSGQRLLVGVIMGIVLYFLNQIVSNLALMLNLNVPLVVMTPVLVILAVALLLFKRMR